MKLTVRIVWLMVVYGWATVPLSAQSDRVEVQLGSQIWSVQNLNVTTFRNGDPIPEVRNEREWKHAAENGQPAWCYYDNKPENGNRYGRLYNWFAIMDERGIAPVGWHIPSKPEWNELVEHLDKYFTSAQVLDSLVSTSASETPEDSFYRFQGGSRLANGSFVSGGQYGYWWGSTCYLSTQSWLKNIRTGSAFRVYSSFNHGDGFSVRCIRDK